LPVVTFLLSWREPTDIAGFPFRGKGRVEYLPAPEIADLIEAGKGILFLDELTTAAPLMQKIALRLIHERVAGIAQLPPGVAIVAAGNPPETAADGYDLAAPLANRMVFIKWGFDIKQWGDYMVSGDENTMPVVPILPDEWKMHLPSWRSQVYAFLTRRQDAIERIPKDPVQAGLAYPTPRSWTMLATGCAAAESVGAGSEVMQLICGGAVGEGAGYEFLHWREAADLPDPEELLAYPSKFKMPKDGSLTFAVMASVVAALTMNPTEERWDATWKIIGKIVAAKQKDVPAVFMGQLRKLLRSNGWGIPEIITEFQTLLTTED
jgi:hypothetical protein